MTAAGRGPRLGGRPTPPWCVKRLLEAWQPREGWLLEPAAGEGAIISCIPDREWIAVEKRPEAAEKCRAAGGNPVICDFLTWEPAAHVVEQISAVITNPPFSLCEEFIRRSSEEFPEADLVFLVSLGFLASQGRVRLWEDLGCPSVYVLPNRPSFTANGKTDSADYCWIVFSAKEREGVFRILNTTPLAERKAGRLVAEAKRGAAKEASSA